MSAKTAAPKASSPIPLKIETMGGLRVWRNGAEIPASAWGREKALALFEFFITMRRRPLQKEAIIERLWPELDADAGDRDFRVALNAMQKALEPERGRRGESQFVRREGLAALIATHNHKLINYTDRTLLLHEGKLVDGGKLTPQQASERMKVSGTAKEYQGLWKAVNDAKPLDAAQLKIDPSTLPRLAKVIIPDVLGEKVEGINPQAEAELEELKANPKAITVAELNQLTIDPNTGVASPLAPRNDEEPDKKKDDKKDDKKDEKKPAAKAEPKKDTKSADKPKESKAEPKKETKTADKSKESKAEPKKETAKPRPATSNVKVDDPIDRSMKGPSGQTIYSGPRGGKYYINSNGNKTYVKAEGK